LPSSEAVSIFGWHTAFCISAGTFLTYERPGAYSSGRPYPFSRFPGGDSYKNFHPFSGFPNNFDVDINFTCFLSIGSKFAAIYITMALSTIRQIDHLSRDELIVSVKELSRLTKSAGRRALQLCKPNSIGFYPG
jgi:hypothetical protein